MSLQPCSPPAHVLCFICVRVRCVRHAIILFISVCVFNRCFRRPPMFKWCAGRPIHILGVFDMLV